MLTREAFQAEVPLKSPPKILNILIIQMYMFSVKLLRDIQKYI